MFQVLLVEFCSVYLRKLFQVSVLSTFKDNELSISSHHMLSSFKKILGCYTWNISGKSTQKIFGKSTQKILKKVLGTFFWFLLAHL